MTSNISISCIQLP